MAAPHKMIGPEEEIRIVEQRLATSRHALADDARGIRATARDALVSPKGLLVAAAVGFLLGEALRSDRQGSNRSSSLAGTLGAVAFSLLRARF